MAKLVVESQEGALGSVPSDHLAAEQMSATTTEKKRITGKAPIYLDLESALKIVREKIDSHTKRVTLSGLAKALDHTDTTALRFRQKVDALIRYNLVTEEGDELVLTDTAINALYSLREKRKARLEAFLCCDDFKRLCDAVSPNSDLHLDEIREYVRTKLHIVSAVDLFIKLFLQSARSCGLYEGGEPSPLPNVFKLRSRGDLLQSPEGGPGEEKNKAQGGSVCGSFRTLAEAEARNETAALGLGEGFNVIEVRVSQPPVVESIVNRDGQAVLVLTRKTEIILDGDFFKATAEIAKRFGGQEPAL